MLLLEKHYKTKSDFFPGFIIRIVFSTRLFKGFPLKSLRFEKKWGTMAFSIWRSMSLLHINSRLFRPQPTDTV